VVDDNERARLFVEIATLRQQRNELMIELAACRSENRALRAELGREEMTIWLTTAEAAEHIKAKDDRLIRQAIKAGDLPACRYGKSEIRIDQAELDEWLRSNPWEPNGAS
jgi:excisionase family DNA binding protein